MKRKEKRKKEGLELRRRLPLKVFMKLKESNAMQRKMPLMRIQGEEGKKKTNSRKTRFKSVS